MTTEQRAAIAYEELPGLLLAGKHEGRAADALADLEEAVARAKHLLIARQRGSCDWRDVASQAGKVSRAAADFATAAEALRALGEVAWAADGEPR